MKKLLLISIILMFFSTLVMSQVTSYKLKNGLTIILNEDHQRPSVFGCVVTKSGSKDDPSDATGLAHYLEHVLFKGTNEIGTVNWEKEKIHYDKIITLYDELAVVDEKKRDSIQKLINEESLLAGSYTVSNEFSNIIQTIGGTGVNAGTGLDMTQYYNTFPSSQLKAWLDIYSHRFVHPVFRGFQAELETVYEEKNMYSDSPISVLREEFYSAYYGEKHPYGRPIIGFSEHLKTPSLSKLIGQYEKFYVPENMGLILSGDFNTEESKKLIEETFGKWESKGKPERVKIEKAIVKGKKKVKMKLTPMPVAIWGFPAIKSGNQDEMAVDIACRLLANNDQTGILDKLVIDGDVQTVSVGLNAKISDGLIQVFAVPVFDFNQLTYTPLSATERMIFKGFDQLKSGSFEDWVFEAIKDKMCREFDLALESSASTGRMLASFFATEQTIEDFKNYKSQVQNVTKEQVIDVANKYLGKDYLVFFSDIGKSKKDKIPKPDLKPIKPTQGERSAFYERISNLPMGTVDSKYIDFNNDLKRGQLAERVNMYYTANPKNDIFTLTLRYGAGENVIPTINLATSLMNKAGILAQFTPYELKKEFNKISCSYNFSSSQSYTYVTMQGKEENLAKACKLLSKTYLLPALDDKQMNSLLGSVIGSRYIEKSSKDAQSEALEDFLMYGDKSPELNRLTNEEIRALTISQLAADFIKATQYETSVHYVGQKDFEEVQNILKSSLAFPSGLSASKSPFIREVKKYEENIIYFLDNKDARQSDVYLMLNGSDYKLEERPYINAFNQYFGGGFNGIVLQELRELRSFAYTAQVSYSTPSIVDKPSYLRGFIGVQGDKTISAVEEFIKLINDLPSKPERMENLKKFLQQATSSRKPSFRNLSQNIQYWEQAGYTEDPAKELTLTYNKMKFEDMTKFYKDHIQGKPIAIAIVGNKRLVDKKELEKIGKVKYLSLKKLFKE